jgi:hypothetical protein
MELERTQPPVENRKSEAKKAYWKPSVQVYGFLAETTKATANPITTKHADGGHGGGWSTLRT